jgi:hypothetical protein
MPIDSMILNPMLDPFRNMAKEIQDKGLSGEAVDRMINALQRMEQLGQDESDIMAFTGKMTSEGLQMEFSNAYGQALSAEAQSAQGNPEEYDDAALLKQSVDALKNAVIELKRAKDEQIAEASKHAKDKTAREVAQNEIEVLNNNDVIIEAIEELIKFGESGVNLPTFLRVQMEKGMDKAMEGSTVVKDGLVYSRGWAEASRIHPFDIEKADAKLRVFEEMSASAKFGVPDSLQVSLQHDKIDHQHIPAIAKWDGLTNAWERILGLIETWAYAHMSFADKIFPWDTMQNPWPDIERTKATNPGEVAGRLRIFQENFGLNFHDIFQDETFIWKVENHQLDASQEWIEMIIKKIFPQCKPGQLLDQETISEVERLWNENRMVNPERHKDIDRFVNYFDSVFGEGAFKKKTGANYDWGNRPAQPWNLANFSIT